MRERETSGCSACKGASRRVGGGGEGGHSGRGLCLYTPSTQDRLSLPRHLRGDRALPSGTSFRRQPWVRGGGGGAGGGLASEDPRSRPPPPGIQVFITCKGVLDKA